MTNVIPFTPRASAGGGWTASERARLAELADRLSAAEGVKVEAVYGVSDEGDPWCAIKDENEEILVHVARIDGQFVIHDAAADAIQEGDSLWTACDRLLGEAWRDPREEVVVPLTVRQAQSVIALAIAVAFIHDVQQAEAAVHPDAAPVSEAAATVTLAALVPEPGAGEEPRHEMLAAQPAEEKTSQSGAPVEATAEEPAAAPQEPAQPEDTQSDPTPVTADHADDEVPASVQTAVNDDAPVTVLTGTDGADTIQGGAGRDEIFAGAGDDSVNGGAGADTLHGGSGADTLDGGGAGPGKFDVLDGGDGDDVLRMGGDVIAVGGRGADTFVITARPGADSLLGTILDFMADDGDRLVFGDGRRVVETNRTELVNATNVPGFGPTTAGATAATGGDGHGFNGFQVWVDLNGDGIADGHVFLGKPGNASGAPRDPSEVASVATSDHHAAETQLPDGYILLA